MNPRPIVLSIAGYDPSSGAGITADVKTAAALGCYAVTCITALTVQSTQGVFAVEPVRPQVVRETLLRLVQDEQPAAVRLGMLGSGAVAEVVAEFLEQMRLPNLVVDPVIRASSGAELIDSQGLSVLRDRILPLAALLTPNLPEAAWLAGEPAAPLPLTWEDALPRLRDLAGQLHQLGCRAVVITGGHLPAANDYLSLHAAGSIEVTVFPGNHIASRATHGTGCAFATAVACGLAKGRNLATAVGEAKEYVRKAILAASPIGKGTGPMEHLFG